MMSSLRELADFFSISSSRNLLSHYLYNLIKMSRIESARGDSMACYLVQCYQAGISDFVILPDHQTYKQAIKQPDASKLMEAIESELKQLGCLGVFSTPVIIPVSATVVGTHLIFKKKRTVDGEIPRYRARLVGAWISPDVCSRFLCYICTCRTSNLVPSYICSACPCTGGLGSFTLSKRPSGIPTSSILFSEAKAHLRF